MPACRNHQGFESNDISLVQVLYREQTDGLIPFSTLVSGEKSPRVSENSLIPAINEKQIQKKIGSQQSGLLDVAEPIVERVVL